MDIHIRDLSRHFKGGVTALDHVNLDVPTGMFGLLGANGAGKTTLMRILAGVLRPSDGTATVGSHDLSTAAGRRDVQRTLGYLPQELGLYPDLTARNFLDYIAILKGLDDRVNRHDRVAQLLDVVSLTDDADRKVGTFSGGMKRRVGIAQALLSDPRLLIVDEPTSGLDPEERIRFRNLLAGLGDRRTVLLSTHIVEDIASSCQRLAVMAKGRVLFTGEVTDLVEVARDRTWRVELPVGVAPEGDLTVVSALHGGATVSYRVVSSGSYPVEGVPVEPTLEDGYLTLMREPATAAR